MWTKPEAMWEENSSGEQSGQGDRSKTPKCNQKKDSFGNTVDLSIKCLVKDCHELSLPMSLAITWFWSDPASRAPTWQVEGDWLKVTLPLVLFISRSWLPPPYSSQTRESTIGSVTSVRSFFIPWYPLRGHLATMSCTLSNIMRQWNSDRDLFEIILTRKRGESETMTFWSHLDPINKWRH